MRRHGEQKDLSQNAEDSRHPECHVRMAPATAFLSMFGDGTQETKLSVLVSAKAKTLASFALSSAPNNWYSALSPVHLTNGVNWQ